MFNQIPGATVILKYNGVYSLSKVFVYDNRLFAKHGRKFVLLHKVMWGQTTSHPKITWEALEGVSPFTKPAHTALYFKDPSNATSA